MDSIDACIPEVKIKQEKIEKPQHECLACGKFISDRRNLVRHLRKIHCIEPIVRKPQLKCSFNDACAFICATGEALREHLEKVHEFNVEKKILNFRSRGEFEKWKQEEEQNTNARYVSYTGRKYRGNKKVYYLRCHRSGAVRSENNGGQRKRVKPSKGYTQCGVTCPSTLRVAETINGNIQVVYYPVHLGHSLDDESVQYIKLSTKEREEIVGKLAQGEPVCKIVSDARKVKGDKLSRINLLQRRDVYNIKKKINYLEKEIDHDGKQIDAWVKALDLDRSLHNPVAFYKPIDESHDYDLILIHEAQKMIYALAFDGSIVYVKTKKGKPHLDLNLVTVSVVCENGDAYPIAFCITHKIEYVTLYTFFKIIYQNVGSIKSQIFVSDNLGQFYLAWKNVMGECDNKLICTFSIEFYWEQKLIALKCPAGKQKTVAARLKLLMEQPDKDVFENELWRLLEEWDEDEDTKLFANFFRKFYVKKRFEWATCYRIHSTRKESINRYLEPINKVLQSIYEESYNSVPNALNLLMSFVRDVCLLKVLQLSEEAAAQKMAEMRRNHGEGLKVKGVRSGNGSEWMVTDEGGEEYIVRSVESECDRSCGVYCECCGICVHGLSCACADYVVGLNVCKHLHAVGIFSGDTKDFVTVALKHVAVWKPDLQPLGEMEAPSGILSMAVCDRMLYTCSADDTIQSWDLVALKNAGRVATTLSNVQKLFFDKTSRRLWAGDSQGNVAKFENGQECGKYELVEEIWDLMAFSDPNLVYTARDRDVVVSEIISGEKTRVMVKATHWGRSPICISGNHLCFLNREGRNVQVHENSVEKKFPHVKEIVASELIINAMAAGGDDVIYTGGYDSTVKKWDIKTGTCSGSLNLGAIINSIACRNENEAYVARSDGFVTKIGA